MDYGLTNCKCLLTLKIFCSIMGELVKKIGDPNSNGYYTCVSNILFHQMFQFQVSSWFTNFSTKFEMFNPLHIIVLSHKEVKILSFRLVFM